MIAERLDGLRRAGAALKRLALPMATPKGVELARTLGEVAYL
jgi:hypothetical protein